MKEKTFKLNASDGKALFCRTWRGTKPAKAILQLSHGMQEHSARYEGLAKNLVKAGYVVYANDHRGHGHTATDSSELSHIGPGGWRRVVADIHELSVLAKKENPNLPLFLLGHSWGSFLAQAFTQQHGESLAGLVLSGTNGKVPALGPAVLLAKTTVALRGGARQAGLLYSLANGRFNKGFGKSSRGNDWLSRDPEVVSAFDADPLCGVPVPNSFYCELMDMFAHSWTPTSEGRIPKKLPIYIFAGTEDPVSNRTQGIIALIQRYKGLGIENIEYRFYLGARHETLNETNKAEVHRDLIHWLDAHVK
ncbi:MAG: alpha/beta hydrolase [Myxococcota bacterium]|nr:alpha/beta hydrolase [Myxococcota bacterium]